MLISTRLVSAHFARFARSIELLTINTEPRLEEDRKRGQQNSKNDGQNILKRCSCHLGDREVARRLRAVAVLRDARDGWEWQIDWHIGGKFWWQILVANQWQILVAVHVTNVLQVNGKTRSSGGG